MTDEDIVDKSLYQAGATAQGCWDKLDDYDKAAFQRALTLSVVFARREERQRLAAALQKMPLNDTANSIAIWILDGGKDVR